MIHQLLYRLSGRLPVRFIKINGLPYLERYYVGKLFGVTLYLHRFVSSDGERHLHNHPWGWGGTVVLSGGYVEERAVDICPHAGPHGCVTEKSYVGRARSVDGKTFHRVARAERNTWTLFMHGARAIVKDENGARRPKGWGFIEKQGRYSVFTPWPGTASDWWLQAPLGRDAAREPEAHTCTH